MSKNYVEVNRVLLFILLLNLLVCAVKIIFGSLSQSASMVADGFHSLTDGASNIIGFVGIWLASRPVDEKHPYGHKKFETFTTIVIAALLFVVCYEVISSAIERFSHPEIVPNITPLSFIVMLGTLAVNLWVSRYETKRGKELSSDFLVSDAMHTASDIYVSISVIIGLIVVKLGLPIVDILMSIVIALIIARAAIGILIHSANILCDAAPIEPETIEDIVNEMDGIKMCHKIRTRGREDDIHVDLHILVDREMSIVEGHSLCHGIENKIKDKVNGVSEVIVHVEPYEARTVVNE